MAEKWPFLHIFCNAQYASASPICTKNAPKCTQFAHFAHFVQNFAHFVQNPGFFWPKCHRFFPEFPPKFQNFSSRKQVHSLNISRKSGHTFFRNLCTKFSPENFVQILWHNFCKKWRIFGPFPSQIPVSIHRKWTPKKVRFPGGPKNGQKCPKICKFCKFFPGGIFKFEHLFFAARPKIRGFCTKCEKFCTKCAKCAQNLGPFFSIFGNLNLTFDTLHVLHNLWKNRSPVYIARLWGEGARTFQTVFFVYFITVVLRAKIVKNQPFQVAIGRSMKYPLFWQISGHFFRENVSRRSVFFRPDPPKIWDFSRFFFNVTPEVIPPFWDFSDQNLSKLPKKWD